MTKWEKFKEDWGWLGWLAEMLAGAMVLTLPMWMILLGLA